MRKIYSKRCGDGWTGVSVVGENGAHIPRLEWWRRATQPCKTPIPVLSAWDFDDHFGREFE